MQVCKMVYTPNKWTYKHKFSAQYNSDGDDS